MNSKRIFSGSDSAPRRAAGRPSVLRLFRVVGLLVFFSLLLPLLSACQEDAHLQQQAQQRAATLNTTVQHALDIGVPQQSLQSILTQKQALNDTHAPFSLFDGKAVNDYYQNLSQRYEQLRMQTQGVVSVTTEQTRQQAQAEMQSLNKKLSARPKESPPLDAITKLYTQDSSALEKAEYPKDYLQINQHAKDALSTINQLPATQDKLTELQEMIVLMKQNKEDVTDLQTQYASDKEALSAVTTPITLKQVDTQIDTHSQQAVSRFGDVIPTIAKSKVDSLDAKVQELKKYGVDTTTYQQKLDEARTKSSSVKTLQDYRALSKLVDADVQGLQSDLLKGKATFTLKQFHQEVKDWGNAHLFHDTYDGKDYPPDMGYMDKGVGEDLDHALAAAKTDDDYQQLLTDLDNANFHLDMFEQDYADKTPLAQSHDSDMKLLNRYQLQGRQVIVVSLAQQSLRVYEKNGKISVSYLVTAGRPELPPVPGLWNVMWRQKDIKFKSPYPKGSPYWYEDTPIHFAMMYHTGGYYLHDSWWRNDYGPGTQYFHQDSSGNKSANYGTHGCVNMPQDQAGWLYNHTDYNTLILIY